MFDDMFDSMFVKDDEEWLVKDNSTDTGIKIMDDKSLRSFSGATLWDDLRVSLETTTNDGANPPNISFYKNESSAIGTSNALHFLKTYGEGILTIPNDTNYDFTSAYSLEFWFFADNSLNSWQDLFSKTGVIRIRVNTYNRLDITTTLGYENSAENSFLRNSWNHCVLTYTGTGGVGNDTYNFHINNTLVISQTGWGLTTNNTNDLIFNPSIAIWKLDNVALWQKEMTISEISNSYNSGNGLDYIGTETNMLGLWKMNEESGITISDSSSNNNNNNGTITGTINTHYTWSEGLVGSIIGTTGVKIYTFPENEKKEVFFSIQMPHKWA
jgi:hypothetical protein